MNSLILSCFPSYPLLLAYLYTIPLFLSLSLSVCLFSHDDKDGSIKLLNFSPFICLSVIIMMEVILPSLFCFWEKSRTNFGLLQIVIATFPLRLRRQKIATLEKSRSLYLHNITFSYAIFQNTWRWVNVCFITYQEE